LGENETCFQMFTISTKINILTNTCVLF